MQRRHLLFMGAGMLLAACTSTPTLTGEGNYIINAVTDPNPLKMGPNRILVTVSDKAGAPVSGAKVRVTAEMMSHNMGEQSGDAQEEGGGKYSLRAGFSMAGMWKVTVTVSKAGLGEGTKKFEFNVG